MADDDNEIGLPQKGLNGIIKDVLPDVRIANDTRDLINQACVEFIRHLSREAQRISSDDQRKTIYHEHIQKALENLGFPPDFSEAADRVLEECKVHAEKRLKRKKSRLDKCGIPEDQLLEMQQKLIEEARLNAARAEQQAIERQLQQAAQQQQSPLTGGQPAFPPTYDAARRFVASSTAPREEEDYDT